MCIPAIAAAAGGVSSGAMMSAGLNAMSSIAQINAQNEAHMRNSENARQAAAHNQDQESEAFVERNRSMLQDAMDRALDARSARDMAFVSAMESGVQGTSVMEVDMDYEAQQARNRGRDADERKSLKNQTKRNLKGHEEQAKGRIAQVAPTGLNMGHIASIASPIVKSIS